MNTLKKHEGLIKKQNKKNAISATVHTFIYKEGQTILQFRNFSDLDYKVRHYYA